MRALWICAFLAVSASSGKAQELSLSLEQARADRLEEALTRSAVRFDAVSYLSAQRSMLVALFEGVCAVGFLVPPSDDGVEVGLGVGCLLGAAVLTYRAFREFSNPRAVATARDRLARFHAARAAGESLEGFEEELAAGARRGLRKRRFAGVFGILNFVATVVLSALIGTDHIDRNTGAIIASGTAAVGVLGVTAFFVESPDELAWRLY
ncbi:MAG: hypothetical protein AAGE52_30065 [Myxococcota bacterium]